MCRRKEKGMGQGRHLGVEWGARSRRVGVHTVGVRGRGFGVAGS